MLDMLKKVTDRLVLASVYRSRWRFHNILSLLKKNGAFFLNDGTIIKFDKNKYDVAIGLFVFSNIYGVKFNNGDWKLDLENNIITTPSGIKFNLEIFDTLIFAETFLHDAHFTGFGLSNKVVIQAGGFIGDAALYYADKGAMVYSFEPEPTLYNVAKKNIELNPHLKNKIVMENLAIGEDGVVKFPLDKKGFSSIFDTVGKETIEVRSMSITTILSTYGIHSPYLLDLDIKGAEFKVIEDETIKEFEIVRIEYLTKIGSVKLGERNYLLEKLQQYGFTDMRIFKHNFLPYDLVDHGTIIAKKKSA